MQTVIETFSTLVKARQAREMMAASKKARYDPVADAYVYREDGKILWLMVRKVTDKYLYEVVCQGGERNAE